MFHPHKITLVELGSGYPIVTSCTHSDKRLAVLPTMTIGFI